MTDEEPAESAGDPFWLYAMDSLSSSRSAWTSGDTPLRISRARRNSGAGSSAPSGRKPMAPAWKFWPVWPEWLLDWAEWRLLRRRSSMLFKCVMSSLDA
jgi:hypothetical protein